MDLTGGQWLDGVEQQLAHLRRESNRTAAQSVAAREEAADAKLQIWLQKLTELQGLASRDVALTWALEAATSVLSADFANVQRLHPTGQGLILEAQRGFGRSFLNFFEFTNDRHSACGLAMQEHRPVIVEDVNTSPIFADTQSLDELQKASVRAVRSMPLVDGTGQMLGMISVHYCRPRAHVVSELKRLQLLAAAVARLLK
ncbi:GAF domain-containing protein [Roseimicrobium gellanilyticum]|uniref:GAF domain-containing protein n=1 Tax=Roseimicrobium gellanilyticum TaxID=748857 RepID=A0A366HET2_9BACT|nr:GAF domain-containing protein [Roseimicrobium gellanilyticum]RBP40550.1 GAF domain-containing protein [Roseimicrobium gellanilyticum]